MSPIRDNARNGGRLPICDRDMYGRLTRGNTWREVHKLYDLTGAARNLQAHYNIARPIPFRS